MGNGSEGRSVITLATADVENGEGLALVGSVRLYLFADQLHEGISQRGVVSLVEEVAPRARLSLRVAHGVASLGRTQQVEIALARTIELVTVLAGGLLLPVIKGLATNWAEQKRHGTRPQARDWNIEYSRQARATGNLPTLPQVKKRIKKSCIIMGFILYFR